MRSPFEPARIGTTLLPNRLVMAPLKTGYGSGTGESTRRHEEFYARRAQGGVGLIILEPMYVHPSGKELPTQLGIHTDEMIDGLARLVDYIHRAGAKVAFHLNHAGRMANPKVATPPLVSASGVPCPSTGAVPRELTTSQIDDILDLYSQAARRARMAGADFIELQAGHGYLIAQFLSPLLNGRADTYGGTLQNRMRLAMEVLREVKAEAGEA